MAAHDTRAAADGAPSAEGGGRGPAVMAGLGCAAAFAALSLAVPFEKILPPSLDVLADSWLVPGLALIGFVVGYLLGRTIGVRRVVADAEAEAEEITAAPPPESEIAGLAVAEPEASANPLIAEPLDRLGPVQLVERLAMAVERNAPPARNTTRAEQLAAQLSALSAMPVGITTSAAEPEAPGDVSDEDDEIEMEEQRGVDERRYSSLLDMGVPRPPRADSDGPL